MSNKPIGYLALIGDSGREHVTLARLALMRQDKISITESVEKAHGFSRVDESTEPLGSLKKCVIE